MTQEQIFLAGAPRIGFGDADISLANPIINRPLIGFLVGTVGGSILGNLARRGVGTMIGAIAGGLGGAVAGSALAMREAHAAAAASQMSPGQVWTAVGLVHPTKEWTDASKGSVENAVILALSKVGILVLDGTWSSQHTFTLMMQPSRTTTLPAALPITSEWADQISFSNVARAPANPT